MNNRIRVLMQFFVIYGLGGGVGGSVPALGLASRYPEAELEDLQFIGIKGTLLLNIDGRSPSFIGVMCE